MSPWAVSPPRFAVDRDEGAELPGNPCAGQAGVRDKAQTLSGAVIDHHQDLELPGGVEAVRKQPETAVGLFPKPTIRRQIAPLSLVA